jgi:hypothetical protein
MITFLQNLALGLAKNANIFAKFFDENIFKNHNIGPWSNIDEESGMSVKRFVLKNLPSSCASSGRTRTSI